MSSGGYLNIGAPWDGNNNNHMFNGKLDDVRIYRGALKKDRKSIYE